MSTGERRPGPNGISFQVIEAFELDPETGTYSGWYDHASADALFTDIVLAVAAIRDTSPFGLNPVYSALDTDGFVRFVESVTRESADGSWELSMRLEGCLVRVLPDRVIFVPSSE